MSFLSQLLGELPEEDFDEDYEEEYSEDEIEIEPSPEFTKKKAKSAPVESEPAEKKAKSAPVEPKPDPKQKLDPKQKPTQKSEPAKKAEPAPKNQDSEASDGDPYSFSGDYPREGKKILSVTSALVVSVTYEIVLPMIIKSPSYRNKLKSAIIEAEKLQNPEAKNPS